MISALFKRLIRSGSLTILDANGRAMRFGPGDPPGIVLRFRSKQPFLRPLLDPVLWFGEAYMNGDVDIEEGTLYGFLDLCTRDFGALHRHPLQRVLHRLNWPLRYAHQFNPRWRSRLNVAHHYDLSGAFYDLFLNRERDYSCAYFETGEETLEDAQTLKKRHIAGKLRLEPGMRVLDIGSGWGGLANYLAQTHGVDVTGLTLSHEQIDIARRVTQERGLGQLVRYALRDYREESGTYDRIVSVGMFEHVGVGQYRRFFAQVARCLELDGIALLHSIGRMEPPGSTNTWLRKYIFPGGYSPALSEVLAAIEDVGLWVTDIEILRLHYADTLREWSRRFQHNRTTAKTLYDERFCRMWEFYLAACEVAFRNGSQMVFQIQLTRSKYAVPRTRDYMVAGKARIAVREA